MTLMDIIIKVLLFFTVFYGAILIASYLGKKIREKNSLKEEDKNL
ncbi:MAG: Unknown protein [uncultured Sulfurovum sp.]|uniref:Uncharacterized protein n=1 Tax=uncultured Sulfurovum sp. TaxID=269237 RepID=A0A6S6TQ66_9BACT|nr:MAG: Unknown protein [uncultured Sulfurovum sp.]